MNSIASPTRSSPGAHDEPSPVLLSGKEISGLALRVVGTALMPFGARGGASDAVEALELLEHSGLAHLEGEIEDCRPAMWHAPQLVSEAQEVALTQAGGASGLFYAASSADWATALVREHGQACIAMLGGQHAHYLHAIPYWLASRGYTGLMLQLSPSLEPILSIASAHDGGWWFAKRAGMPLGLAPTSGEQAIDLDVVRALRSTIAQWIHQPASSDVAAPGDARPLRLPDGALCLVYASAAPVSARARQAFCAEAATITSAELRDRKRKAGADGWPIDRARWEHLMRFGDLSLIPSSEQSRAGAG